MEIFSTVGQVVTVIAFLIAIFQLYQARQQTKDLERHEKSLTTIASALSTRYLGTFPHYLATVTELLTRATRSVTIVTGNPTPAYFSYPMVWNEYRHVIANKLYSGVDVTLISMTATERLLRVKNEFDLTADAWGQWRIDNAHDLETFLRQRYPEESLSQSLTIERFHSMLVETQDALTDDLFRSATTKIDIDSAIVLQAWVIDDREAVFTIETLAENGLSHGLYTSDPKFVSALQGMSSLFQASIVSITPPDSTPKPISEI